MEGIQVPQSEQKVGTLGTHIICDFWDCEINLDDLNLIKESLILAAKNSNCNILNIYFHKFSQHGVSGAIVISESHLTIHTWPQENYAAIDAYTCGKKANSIEAIKFLEKIFKPKKSDIKNIERGNNFKTIKVKRNII